MQNFKEIGPAVCSGEYPGMKNGGASYNMSQPVMCKKLRKDSI